MPRKPAQGAPLRAGNRQYNWIVLRTAQHGGGLLDKQILFETMCAQLERELQRKLTPDERSALRLADYMVEPIPIVDRRKKPRDGAPDTGQAKASD